MNRNLIFLVVIAITAGPAAAADIIQVPSEASLQNAIDTIADGGIIQVAPGSYTSPTLGFAINNPGRIFTIEPVSAGVVTLDGGNSRPVLRYLVDNPAMKGSVVFKDIVFANGLSLVDGTAGGVTLNQAQATFIGCTFDNNEADPPDTGGGAVGVFNQSTAVFIDCLWTGNAATNGGAGIRVGGESKTYIHSSQFIDNRSNLTGHRSSSSAGGIDVNDSTLRVTNSRFDGNEAGFAGGAIFTIGTWLQPYGIPQSEVVAANCTFSDNKAERAAGQPTTPPTEGGAIHAEDQALVRIYNSRFVTNRADLGGAVSLYRSDVAVDSSAFFGNEAVAIGQSTGFGGAIKLTSDDAAEDGNTNFPSSTFALTDSYLQGRYGQVTTTAQVAGCLFASGDITRQYGTKEPSVPQIPGLAANRSQVSVDRTVLADCDVDRGGVTAQGLGGALSVSLADFDMVDSMIIASDAFGFPTSAGALRIVFESDAQIDDTTFAGNTATRFGGAVFAQATGIDFDGCQFFGNEHSPGSSEPENESFGAALFTAPIENIFPDQLDIDVTGTVSNSTLSLNIGIPVFDDDRNPSPINGVQYNGNTFHNATFSDTVYRHSMQGSKNVSELNSLVIPHSGVDKATVNNTWLSNPPVLGAILAVPPAILPEAAAGDLEVATESYLGFAWSGGSATLNSSPVSGGVGWVSAAVGTHTLDVDGQQFQATILQGSTPAATFTASPASISSGETSTLSWSTTAGSYLDVVIDHGVNIVPDASGDVVVSPTATTTYTLYIVTKEGGVTMSATVLVDDVPPDVFFSDGFESGDTSAWSDAVQ